MSILTPVGMVPGIVSALTGLLTVKLKQDMLVGTQFDSYC